MTRLLALLCVVLVAAACGDDTDVTTGDPGPTDPREPGGEPVDDRPGGSWTLVSGRGPDGLIPLVDGYGIDLTFDHDRGTVGGRAACNQYGGTIRTVGGGTWDVDGYSSTEMGCPEPGVHDSEQTFLAALALVDTYALGDDATLVLTGSDVELRFVFEPPAPRAELVGTLWVLDGLVDGSGDDGSVSRGVGMESSRLALAEDGTFDAVLGCNTATGTWSADGSTLSLEVGGVTEIGCSPEEDIVERHVLSVFTDELTFEIRDTRLLIDGAGGTGLHYVEA